MSDKDKMIEEMRELTRIRNELSEQLQQVNIRILELSGAIKYITEQESREDGQ